MRDDRRLAEMQAWAWRYFDLGFQPIPSCARKKAPAIQTTASRSYRDYFERPIEPVILEEWWGPNIQLVTGVTRFPGYGHGPNLVVVDIDGSRAMEVWRSWSACAEPVHCWASVSGGCDVATGRVGLHLWFGPPAGFSSLPSRRLWGEMVPGPDGRHRSLPDSEIKLLADRALVVAPPSIHPSTSRRYRWLVGPDDFAGPDPLPAWLAHLAFRPPPRSPGEGRPRSPRRAPAAPPVLGPLRPRGPSYGRQDVLAAIPDLVALAEEHGLEVARLRPVYADCYSPFRRDRDPSCTLHRESGVYMDWATDERLSYFDLLNRLDPAAFPDFESTCNTLGARYIGGTNGRRDGIGHQSGPGGRARAGSPIQWPQHGRHTAGQARAADGPRR